MSLARSGPRIAVVFLLALGAAACAPPLQSGGVVVLPGSAERLDAVCRWHRGQDAFCADEPEVAALAPAPGAPVAR